MTAAVPIRIGISSLDVAALPIYADATGAFAERGLVADIRLDLGHPQDVVRMVAAGELDLGYCDIITAVRSLEAQLPIRPAYPGGQYDRDEPIVVLGGAAGTSVADVCARDAPVIMTPSDHDLARVGVRAWAATNGIDPSRITFRSGIPMRDAGTRLAEGDVDAAIISEPQRSLQAAQVTEISAPFDAIAPAFIMGAYVVSASWCDAYAGASTGLASALRATARWANNHRSETGAVLAQHLGFPPALLGVMRRARYAESVDDDLLLPAIRSARAQGEIIWPDDRVSASFRL